MLTFFHELNIFRRQVTRIASDAREDSRRSGGSRFVFAMMAIQRVGHHVQNRSENPIRDLLLQTLQTTLVYYPRQIELPFATVVGAGLRMPHPKNITINSSAKIGMGCTIYHNVTIGSLERDSNAAPTIGSNVFVGTGAVVLGPVTIGPGAKIGANAVVTRDVPAHATVVGNNEILRR